MPPVKVRGSLSLGFALHIALYTLAADTYYIVQGAETEDCKDKDENCTTRAVGKHEVNAVQCCADCKPERSSQYDDWPTSQTWKLPFHYTIWTYKHEEPCKLWVLSFYWGDICYMAQWEKASWLCKVFGGRLCSKTELENGCTAISEKSTCNLDAYMIWSSTPGKSSLSDYVAGEYYYKVWRWMCWESQSNCKANSASQCDSKAVRCCSDTRPDDEWNGDSGWEYNSKGGFWNWSKYSFCYLVDWTQAEDICSEVGGRLCTMTELHFTKGTGCLFDFMTVWSNQRETLITTVAPTDSPEYPTMTPTFDSTDTPAESLSGSPTQSPGHPTDYTTLSPTKNPTRKPTLAPTKSPTAYTTCRQTLSPTYKPSYSPTMHPTDWPTKPPTNTPTPKPTSPPTFSPTDATRLPTPKPMLRPTKGPEYSSSNSPTSLPIPKSSLVPSQPPYNYPTQSPDAPTSNPTPIPGQTQSTHSYTPTTSSTRVPSADCIETEQNWTEEIAKQLCSAVEMGVTKKGVDAVVCPDYNQYYQRRLNYSLANGAFTHCSAWCVYDAYKEGYGDPSERYDAFIWSRWNGCYQPIRSGVCIYGNINDRDKMADYIDALCESCPSYTWDDDRAEELCPHEESKRYGVEVCDDPKSSTKQDSLDKSLANRFFTHCHAFCVYDYDTIMNNARNLSNTYGGYIWKRTCWKWVTEWDCFTKHISEFEAVSLRAVNQCEL